ncbi:carbohydrate ABC transporter permease [Micromonospora sp. 067-2]|uniref:carbohydrate ABC transporter permease n=1 Tax=Micromonospora sp. 067-2 TaxID=2789270 RepID=UPI00397C925F
MSTSITDVRPDRAAAPPAEPVAAARGQHDDGTHGAVLARAVTSRRDQAVMYAILAVMAALWAFPLYAAIRKSLEVHGFDNYLSLFTDPVGDISIPRTYLNSLIVGLLHAVAVVVVSTSAGYAFSILRWPGRDLAFAVALLFLAIPAAAMIVPAYRINNELGLFNSYLGVALPEAAITIPFGVLLMRNFGRNLQPALFEAAGVDGAGHLRVFRSIFLPLCRPALINLSVLCFVWSLQDFMWPSIFLRDRGMQTAAQAVATLNTGLGASPTDIARYNASLVLLAIPAIVIVLFGMRHIIGGLSSGGTKE